MATATAHLVLSTTGITFERTPEVRKATLRQQHRCAHEAEAGVIDTLQIEFNGQCMPPLWIR